MIISILVKSVIRMDAKSVVNASSLRDLYDTFMNRTRALEALGEDPMSHGCILLLHFETKLPLQLLEKWELKLADTQEDEIGLELFFKFLSRQVVSKEAGERSSNVNITPGNHSSAKGKENRRKSSFPKMGGENEMYTASALPGIAEIENPVMSQEEERAVADFNRGFNFDGHNYEVRLPWKRDPPKLESNYA